MDYLLDRIHLIGLASGGGSNSTASSITAAMDVQPFYLFLLNKGELRRKIMDQDKGAGSSSVFPANDQKCYAYTQDYRNQPWIK